MAQDDPRPARRSAETVSVLTYRTGVQDANIAGKRGRVRPVSGRTSTAAG